MTIESDKVSVTRIADMLKETSVAIDVTMVLKMSVAVLVVNKMEVVPGTSIVRLAVLVVNTIDVVPGTSTVRTVVTGTGTVNVKREVLPRTSVVSKVRVVLEMSVRISVAIDVLVMLKTSVAVSVVETVDVVPGTSIVRTVVLETGIVAVVIEREVLPKMSVVSIVRVVLKISCLLYTSPSPRDS